MSYTLAIRRELIAGRESHGSVAKFLDDETASANARNMYVAELLSVWTGAEVRLVSADDRRKLGALRDVHMTDGETMIAHYSDKQHVTYDECAPFLANAFALKGGASSWQRVIVVCTQSATICPALRELGSKGLGRFDVSRSALHVFASVLANKAFVEDDFHDFQIEIETAEEDLTLEETDEEAEAVEADLGTAGIDGVTKT